MDRKQDYSPEFRMEVVKLVLEEGLSQGEAARRLAIPKGTLANWVASTRARASGTSAGNRDLEQENARLRKELAAARQERDI